MQYSITFVGAITQFLVVMGLLTSEEAAVAQEGIVALISLILLGITIYGRIRAGGVNIFGFKK